MNTLKCFRGFTKLSQISLFSQAKPIDFPWVWWLGLYDSSV